MDISSSDCADPFLASVSPDTMRMRVIKVRRGPSMTEIPYWLARFPLQSQNIHSGTIPITHWRWPTPSLTHIWGMSRTFLFNHWMLMKFPLRRTNLRIPFHSIRDVPLPQTCNPPTQANNRSYTTDHHRNCNFSWPYSSVLHINQNFLIKILVSPLNGFGIAWPKNFSYEPTMHPQTDTIFQVPRKSHRGKTKGEREIEIVAQCVRMARTNHPLISSLSKSQLSPLTRLDYTSAVISGPQTTMQGEGERGQ